MQGVFKKFVSFLTALTMSFTMVIAGINVQTVSADTVDGVSEWGSLAIGGGGFVTGIVAGQEKIYARTDVGGAYRLDNGKWVQLMNFVSEADVGLLSVEGIGVDPTNDNNLYLLCGCGYFSNGKTVVMRSTDGGNSFEQTDVTSLIRVHGNSGGRQNGERIQIDPNSPNVVYASGRTGGIIKSTDYGKTWTLVNDLGVMNTQVNWPSWTTNKVNTTSNSRGIPSLLIDKSTGSAGKASTRIFAAASVIGQANIFVSEDGGATFNVLSESLPTNYYPQRMKFDPNGNVIISYIDGYSGAIYRYNTSSKTVDDISISGNHSVGDVIFNTTDSNQMFACTMGHWQAQKWDTGKTSYGDMFYKTTDGGATWTRVTITADNPLTDPNNTWISSNGAIHWAGSMETDPKNNNKMFVASGNGIFACDNIWDEKPDFYAAAIGVEEVVPYDITSIPDSNVYYVTADYDGFVSTSTDVDDYAKQHKPPLGSCMSIAYNPYNTSVLARASADTNSAYTLDGGTTWTTLGNDLGLKSGDTAVTTTATGANRIFRSPTHIAKVTTNSDGTTTTTYVADTNVYYTDDYGATWNVCSGITGPVSFEVDSVNKSCVYACKGGAFYYSSDYGKTFTTTAISSNYSKIAHATGIAGKIFVPASNGILVTKDGGRTFNSLPNVQYCKAVGVGKAKNEAAPLTIYMWGKANSTGVMGLYYSTDDGETWKRLNDDEHQFGGPGNGNFVVGDMNTFGTVYMSTVGLGVVYHKFTEVYETDTDLTVETINNDDENITYTGNWKYAGNRNYGEYMSDITYTTTVGDSFEYTFTGTGIDYIAPQGGTANQYASLDIYIDGTKVDSFTNSTASAVIQQQPIYSVRNLDNGTHTIKVVKTGGSTYFQVDALKVYGPLSVDATAITLNKTSTSITVGKTQTLTATVTPDNATNKNVTWSSSDESIATVDQNGTVTGIKLGTATVKATDSTGNIASSCTVKVVGTRFNTETVVYTEADVPTGLDISNADNVKIYYTVTNDGGKWIYGGVFCNDQKQVARGSLNPYGASTDTIVTAPNSYEATLSYDPTKGVEIGWGANNSGEIRIDKVEFYSGTTLLTETGTRFTKETIVYTDDNINLDTSRADSVKINFTVTNHNYGWIYGGIFCNDKKQVVRGTSNPYGSSTDMIAELNTKYSATLAYDPTQGVEIGWGVNNGGEITINSVEFYNGDLLVAKDTVIEDNAVYSFTNANSGKLIEVQNGLTANGTNVWQNTNPTYLRNSWRLVPAGDGYYQLQSWLSSTGSISMDIPAANTADGTNIIIYTTSSAKNQLFKLVRNDDGSYSLRTKITNDASCVEVADSSLDDGANVQQSTYTGDLNQHWFLIKVG